MSRGVSNVWVPVDDMDRAVRFYTEVLGLGKGETQTDEWTELDADGVLVCLNGRTQEETRPGGGPGGAVIAFRGDDDLEGQADRLREQGVDVVDGVADRSWGRVLPLRDPDGNDLELFAPPQG